ncbi:hypothetical protein BD289DRAFT_503466 [Coniella lustricola]|uniref:Uncharacterized protein n=1 Tax=Coniella lustricola TaxID=2025994 RepID=A0A2T3AHP1_9PEZI|nr:hypothetical protein BD289DRAFT_503466 [Coniella lustricola]
MHFSSILVGMMAVNSTTAFITPVYPLTKTTPALVERDPLNFGLGLIDAIKSIPGLPDIKNILGCFKNDVGWEADWSKEDQGMVRFENVDKECCEITEAAWNKHKESWGKFGLLIIEYDCSKGKIKNMTPENAKRLHLIMGDHGGQK